MGSIQQMQLRVMMISERFPPVVGGVPVQVSMLADRLAANGVEVEVVTGPVKGGRDQPRNCRVQEIDALNLDYIADVFGAQGASSARAEFSRKFGQGISQRVAEFHPHIVHVHDAYARGGEIADVLFRLLPTHIPVVNTIHAGQTMTNEYAPRQRRHAALPWDLQIAVSGDVEERLPGLRTAVIPAGCDGELFHPRYEEADNNCSIANSPHPWVVVPSQPSKEKGHPLALDALELTVRSIPDIKLLTGSEYGYVHPKRRQFTRGFYGDVKRRGLTNNVRSEQLHHRNLPSIFRCLSRNSRASRLASGIVWHLSRVEAFPTALLEAQACGAVPIITDIPGQREAIIPGVTGIIVPLNDPIAVARETVALLSDIDRMREMSAHASDFGRTFWIDQPAEKLLHHYEKLIAQNFALRSPLIGQFMGPGLELTK